jgi:hypothetical protein
VDWCAINASKTVSLDSVVQQDLGDVCGMINLCRTGVLPSIYANIFPEDGSAIDSGDGF